MYTSRWIVATIFCCTFVPQAIARDWYVSPEGNAAGLGTLSQPSDLATVLGDNTQPRSPNRQITGGDTIWLLPGTYKGPIKCALQGTDKKPIVIRNYKEQRAMIDHPSGEGISILGAANLVLWGLEFTCTSPIRKSAQDGPWPTDIPYSFHITINNSKNIKVVNCHLSNGSGGFMLSSTSQEIELTGNLISYSGWIAKDRAHGHGIYAQNQTGVKRFAENVVFYNSSHGMHAYGSGAAFVENMQMQGNVFFQNGELFENILRGRNFLMGGGPGARQETVKQNMIYRRAATSKESSSDFMLGYTSGVSDSVVRENYVVGQTYHSGPFANVEIVDNTFIGEQFSDPARNVLELYPQNQFVKKRPTAAKIFVRPNPYEPGRGHITIFNWPLADTVAVDLAALGYQAGEAYELHNVLDFHNDVLRGTYQGQPIAVPMQNHTVAAPSGIAAPLSTFPEFGVFVALKPPANKP